MKKLVDSMENNYGLLGLTDVVWNHTADNSKWLQEHPEVGYNVSTAPWLRSALELDTELLKLSKNLSKLGLPTTLKSEEDLLKIMDSIKENVIAKLKFWEYYVIDVERNADAAVESWSKGEITFPEGGFGGSDFGGLETIKNSSPPQQSEFLARCGLINKDRLGERYYRRVDPKVAAALLTAIYGRFEGQTSDAADRGAARSHIVKGLG